MIRVLYINDDPQELLIKEAFESIGIRIELTVARTSQEAKKFLKNAAKFDTVFMDYKLDGYETAVSSGLVKLCLENGFGVGKKPLIAYSQGHNDALMEAGCTHSCGWFDLDVLICKLFTL